MRRMVPVAVLIFTLVAMGCGCWPSITAAQPPTVTTGGGSTTIADPRVDANATVQDALRFSQATPPTAGPLQDTREIAPNERQYLSSGVHLQDFIAQYSFVVPASDDWMLGFTFWDDDQGNSWDLSILGSGSGGVWGLGHTMANQWQAEQVADLQSLGLTPGTQAHWTLVVYNGVAMLADSSGPILGMVDIGKTGIGDVTAKMGWGPADGDPAPSLTISISDFQVWDLSSLQSTAAPVESFPVIGVASSPVLPPMQETGTIGMIFDHARNTALGNPPLTAGFYGFMTQAPEGEYVFQSVKANVIDFYTIITVINPVDNSTPFDFGIGFRSADDGSMGYVISVRSDGTWELDGLPDAQGTVSGLNQEPGAANTIELLVQGGTALLVVNGVVQTQFDVSGATDPSNVYLFSGYVPGSSVDGRRVSYQDWWLFPISA